MSSGSLSRAPSPRREKASIARVPQHDIADFRSPSMYGDVEKIEGLLDGMGGRGHSHGPLHGKIVVAGGTVIVVAALTAGLLYRGEPAGKGEEHAASRSVQLPPAGNVPQAVATSATPSVPAADLMLRDKEIAQLRDGMRAAQSAHEQERRALEARIAEAQGERAALAARADEAAAALDKAQRELAEQRDRAITASALASTPDPALLSALEQARQEKEAAAQAAGDAARRSEALQAELGQRSQELARANEAVEKLRSGSSAAAAQAGRELGATRLSIQETRNLLDAERSKRERAEEQVAELTRQQAKAEEAAGAKQAAFAKTAAEAAVAAAESLRQAEARAAGAERDNAALRATLDGQKGQLARTEAALSEASRARAASDEATAQNANARRGAEETARALNERLRQEQAKSAASQRQVDSLRASLDAERGIVAAAEAKLAEAARERRSVEDIAAQNASSRKEAEGGAKAASERLRQEQARTAEVARQLEASRADLEAERSERRQLQARLVEIERVQASATAEREDAARKAADAASRASLAEQRAQAAEREVEQLRSGLVGASSWLEERLRKPPAASAEGGRVASSPAIPAFQDILTRVDTVLRSRDQEIAQLRRGLDAQAKQEAVRFQTLMLDPKAMWAALPATTPERRPAPQVVPAAAPAPVAIAEPRSPGKERQHAPSSGDASSLVSRAEAFLSRGDVVGARLLLEYAAAEGQAPAIFRLAETYDPRGPLVRRLGSAMADRERAIQLYRSALSAGIRGAEERIANLN